MASRMDNSAWIDRVSKKFSSLGSNWQVDEIAPYVWVVSPVGINKKPEMVRLSFGAITHGNETVGLAAFDSFLSFLTEQKGDYSLGFFLGNPEACRQNVRYIERDLNRGFSAPSPSGKSDKNWSPTKLEELRAVEIQKLLARTEVLIDLHQTKCPSERAFWIMQMSGAHYHWARSIDQESPFVCYDGNFSADGDGTCEYVRGLGRVALTIESGQEGIHPEQVDFMTMRMQRAYAVAGLASGPKEHDPRSDKELYTWDQTISNTPQSRLVPGLKNFSLVERGTVYGYEENRELVAEKTAMSLFPKYPRPAQTVAPAELIRFLKPYVPLP